MLAGERADADDLDRLDGLVERMLDVDHFDDYRRADIRFHVGLAEAARSPRLVSAMTEGRVHNAPLTPSRIPPPQT